MSELMMVRMDEIDISKKCVCIVKFGPATPVDGFKVAEYYQVTIDPAKASKGGEFIRFGDYPGDEILGWQRIKAMTILEVIGEYKADGSFPPVTIGHDEVSFMAVTKED